MTYGVQDFGCEGVLNYASMVSDEQIFKTLYFGTNWTSVIVCASYAIDNTATGTNDINGGACVGLSVGSVGPKDPSVQEWVGYVSGRGISLFGDSGYGLSYINSYGDTHYQTPVTNVSLVTGSKHIYNTGGAGYCSTYPTIEATTRKWPLTTLFIKISNTTMIVKTWFLQQFVWVGTAGNKNYTLKGMFSNGYTTGNGYYCDNQGFSGAFNSGVLVNVNELDTVNIFYTGSAALRVYNINVKRIQ